MHRISASPSPSSTQAPSREGSLPSAGSAASSVRPDGLPARERAPASRTQGGMLAPPPRQALFSDSDSTLRSNWASEGTALSTESPPGPQAVTFAAQAGPSTATPAATAAERRRSDGLSPADRQDRAARGNNLADYRDLVASTPLFPHGNDDPGARHLRLAAGTGADRIVRFLLEDPRAHGRDMAARTAERALREHLAQGGDDETAARFRDVVQACREHRALHGGNPLAILRNAFRRIR